MKAVLASYTLSLAVFIPITFGLPTDSEIDVFCAANRLFTLVHLVRHLEQHPLTRCLPHPAGLRRLHDGDVAGSPWCGRLRNRSSPYMSSFRFPASTAPMLDIADGLIVDYLHW